MTQAPCLDQDLVEKMNIRPLCDLVDAVTNHKATFLKLMKFTKQSPTIYEDKEEYMSVFENINSTLSEGDYIYAIDENKRLQRQNAFVSLCNHNSSIEKMTYLNCNIFKRSFSNRGLGFTYNNAKVEDFIKKSARQEDAIRRRLLNIKETKKIVLIRVILEFCQFE